MSGRASVLIAAAACLMTLISSVSVAEMTLTSPEITGEVVDAQTGQAIGEAIVSAKWDGLRRTLRSTSSIDRAGYT